MPPPGLSGPIETILFDAGGILLDLDYAYLRRLIEVRGTPVDILALGRAEAIARREVERMVREGALVSGRWREYFHVLLHEVGVPAPHRDPIIDSLWEAHQRVGLWTVAIPGAREVVAALRERGLRLGVVSNAEGRVALDLDGAGYEGLFDTVVDSFHVGVEKPDPAIFRLALERMGASPTTAIHVGDMPAFDVVGATAAGLTPILVDPYDFYGDAVGHRLRSLSELPALLDGAPLG